MKCPFPITLDDEASGIQVPNQRAWDWLDGYVAGWKDSEEIRYDEQRRRQGEADIHTGSVHGTEAGSEGDGGFH